MKNEDDLVSLDDTTAIVEVMSGVCSDPGITDWEFCDYSMLKELTVGNTCFQYVKDFKIEGLHQLVSVVFGSGCFCRTSGGVFEIRECERLYSVKIGDGSFIGVASVTFESEGKGMVIMDRLAFTNSDSTGKGGIWKGLQAGDEE